MQQAQNNALAQQQAQAQTSSLQLANQAAQTKAAQDAAYNTAIQKWQADGAKPAQLASLAAQFPDHAEQLQIPWKLKNDDQKQGDLNFYAQVQSAASNNRPDLALKLLQDRRSALNNAHADTTAIDDTIMRLMKDPATALPGVKSYALGQMYAADPANFVKMYGAEDAKPVTFGGDGIGHYEGTHLVVDREPSTGPKDPRQNYVEVKNADGTTSQRYIGDGGQPGAGSMPTALPDIADRIGTIEGTGPNPASSAAGYGQFTNATWLRTFKAQNPNSGLTDTQILAQRSNPTVAKQMLGALTGQNAQILQAANVPVTGTNVYLAHFLGAPTALAIAHADPSTPISQLVSTAAIRANPTVLGGGKTVGDVQNWAASRMTGGVPGSGASGRDITGSPTGASGADLVGNPDLSGDAALAALRAKNPGVANRIQAILDTRLPYPNPNTVSRSPQNQAIQNALYQIDPTFDAAAWKRRADTIAAYSPKGSQGQSLISAATIINHLYDMAAASQKLPDHLTKAQNQLSNWWSGQTNNKDLIAYNEGRKFNSTEIPKFLTGKAPAQGEIEQAYNSYDPALGATGIKQAITSDLDYISGRFGPLLQAYRDQTGKDFDLDKLVPGKGLSTKLAALENWQSGGKLAPPSKTLGTTAPPSSSASAAAQPVHIAGDSDYARLPSGTRFIGPDGQVRRKP